MSGAVKTPAAPDQIRVETCPYSQREIDKMSTEALLAAYKQTGFQELKWPLCLRYVGLVKSIALQICGVYCSFAQVNDIVNEGVITLLKAVDKFDPEKGVKFETFVAKRIRGMVIDLARQQDWLPRSVRRRSREIDQAMGELFNELGRYPTDGEIAQRLGISQTKYQEGLSQTALCGIVSLDALFESREQGDTGLAIPSCSSADQPEQRLQEQELREKLIEGIGSLRDNEQMVLSLYYEQELNMREIAQVMGVSEPRISQIHSRAIHKLRLFLRQYMDQD